MVVEMFQISPCRKAHSHCRRLAHTRDNEVSQGGDGISAGFRVAVARQGGQGDDAASLCDGGARLRIALRQAAQGTSGIATSKWGTMLPKRAYQYIHASSASVDILVIIKIYLFNNRRKISKERSGASVCSGHGGFWRSVWDREGCHRSLNILVFIFSEWSETLIHRSLQRSSVFEQTMSTRPPEYERCAQFSAQKCERCAQFNTEFVVVYEDGADRVSKVRALCATQRRIRRHLRRWRTPSRVRALCSIQRIVVDA